MGKVIVQCWKEDLWLKILTITSILLIVAAFCIPPMAIIDGSVLAATGILTGLAAIWQFNKAINKNLDAKVRIKEIELQISKGINEELDKEEDDDLG